MIFIGSLPLYFNSRPSARGDPVNVERKSFTPSHFNSRPSARGDVRVLVAAIIGAISIHAPPRGATLVFCSSFAFCPFQFTPLREGRLSSFLSSVPHQLFQFTPLREGRPSIPRGTVTTTPSFQFTPLREGRLQEHPLYKPEMLFQFTPLREGRRWTWGRSPMRFSFQFTPLREGRLLMPAMLQTAS